MIFRQKSISIFKGVGHEATDSAEICIANFITEDEL
jgi:hypothetical protein